MPRNAPKPASGALDQEPTARQKSEHAAEDLRTELAQSRSEARDAAVAQAESRARLEAQTATLAGRLAAAERAQRRAERAEAEAALARPLLAELCMAPNERTGARRKAGGQGPIANEEPSAPALPLRVFGRQPLIGHERLTCIKCSFGAPTKLKLNAAQAGGTQP